MEIRFLDLAPDCIREISKRVDPTTRACLALTCKYIRTIAHANASMFVPESYWLMTRIAKLYVDNKLIIANRYGKRYEVHTKLGDIGIRDKSFHPCECSAMKILLSRDQLLTLDKYRVFRINTNHFGYTVFVFNDKKDFVIENASKFNFRHYVRFTFSDKLVTIHTNILGESRLELFDRIYFESVCKRLYHV